MYECVYLYIYVRTVNIHMYIHTGTWLTKKYQFFFSSFLGKTLRFCFSQYLVILHYFNKQTFV